jgi:hypothetical protein
MGINAVAALIEMRKYTPYFAGKRRVKSEE